MWDLWYDELLYLSPNVSRWAEDRHFDLWWNCRHAGLVADDLWRNL